MMRSTSAFLSAAWMLFYIQVSLGAVLTARLPLVSKTEALEDQDNSLDANVPVLVSHSNEWVKIDRSPPALVKHSLGSVLELECEASGKPAPVVQWLRDNSPITEFDDYENNAIMDTPSEGMAQVLSKLIINNVTPADRTTYTCLAQSGIKTATATTEVFTKQGLISKPHNLSSYLALNREIMEAPSAPHIVQHYVSLLEDQGRSVILPCKAIGNPRPQIYWFDNDNNPILQGNPRVKVLGGGELLIAGLRWSDMGGYTCVAKNSISKDSALSFVYPLANE